ncbi:MAG: hypothetical protein OIF47_15645 [Marinibacterium sp.]|nr:hypothetical protein [Marinibacterium sp.]
MTRLALIDGPLPAGFAGLDLQHACCDLHPRAAQSPAARHARQMALAAAQGAGDLRIDNYVVFPGKLATSTRAICDALDAARQGAADVVLCALGMAHPAPVLAAAVAAVLDSGKQIIASASARGGAVYPAGFDGVIAVQGDARCGPSDWSHLDLPQAQFGACARGGDPQIRGASVAAAHFAGLYLREERAGRHHAMARGARFQGRERITGPR